MSSSRDDVLAAVRASVPDGDYPLPDVQVCAFDDEGDLTAAFVRTLGTMGGKTLELHGRGVRDAIREEFPDAQVVVSATAEVPSDRDVSSVTHAADLHDVDVAVVRASLGVAESGSVLLTDDDLGVNTLGYLAQHLVVLLDPAQIVPGLQDAYLNDAFRSHHYTVFHTGPSATADIEGVLIHGAQGVRSLHILLANTAG